MAIVQSGEFQRDAEHKESLLRWMSLRIADEGEYTEGK